MNGRDLRTLVTEWTVRSVEDGAEFVFRRTMDSWLQGDRVAGVGADGNDDTRVRFMGKSGFEIRKVEVLYAEYVDGTVEGRDAECLGQQMAAQRRQTVAAHRALAARIAAQRPSLPELQKELQLNREFAYLQIKTAGASVAGILAEAVRIGGREVK